MRRAPDPRRLRVHTWNMGGCSSDAYDVLCEWLERQQDLEVLLLQETHWGLGRTESQWSTMGWTWFSSPDPARRYAGVAIVVSKRLAPSTACTFCEWVPGRVLQVRVECEQLSGVFYSVSILRTQKPLPHNPSATASAAFRASRRWHVSESLHVVPSARPSADPFASEPFRKSINPS